MGISITDEYFERYYEEDLPAVLSSVEGATVERASMDQAMTQKLMEENESLRIQLKEYQELELKRREFANNQRRQDRDRRERQTRT